MNKIYLPFFALLLSSLLFSCHKGKDLPGTAYGRLSINSTFQPGAAPIIIQIDGQTIDTLSEQKQSIYGIPLPAGARTYKLIKSENLQPLIETTLEIITGKVIEAPPFLYDGTVALFDDLTAKPERDSMLVRFMNQVPNFPEVVDLHISAFIIGSSDIIPVKSVKGVRKDRFSDFIQLPDLKDFMPTNPGETATYRIEATDPSNNDAVLIPGNRYAGINTLNGRFAPNCVLSIGLNPPTRSLYIANNIFERIVQ